MDKGLISPLHNLVASLVPGLPQAQSAVQLVKAFIVHRGRHRAEKLAQGLELAWSYMDESDQKHFEALCNNPHFQEQVAEYIEAALNTPSEIVIKAIALLMLNDPDCRLDDAQKERFVHGFTGLSDQAAELFISLIKTPPLKEKIYPIHIVGRDHSVSEGSFTPDEILRFTQSFFNRGIILPEPKSNNASMAGINDDDNWFVKFGVNDEISQYKALLEKAKVLG